MDPHSFWPPARRRRGKEGDQAVLETGDAGGARLRAKLGVSSMCCCVDHFGTVGICVQTLERGITVTGLCRFPNSIKCIVFICHLF